jgi:hypothetical protein
MNTRIHTYRVVNPILTYPYLDFLERERKPISRTLQEVS